MHRLTWIVPLLTVLFVSTAAPALELVMFRRAGCSWCAAWDREIGPIYPKTEVGRRAPVRFANTERPSEAKVALKSPVRYSPTFVVVQDNRELARIEGYPGQDFFWARLERLVPEAATKDGAQSRARQTAEAPR
jgi:thioredoxin-related protein